MNFLFIIHEEIVGLISVIQISSDFVGVIPFSCRSVFYGNTSDWWPFWTFYCRDN